jgi:hypothetical protein
MKHTTKAKMKMRLAKLGKKLSVEHKRKISQAQQGEKCYNWKGDLVGYRALHTWVVKKLGSPLFCEHCKRTKPPKGKGIKRSYFQWANISKLYLRDVRDWKRLCYKCHNKFDQ